ncbi:hypothetical protein WKV52_09015, partial [Tetragenococcus halophilus]|uniref:hypothetical protein n=1 Tax=Tetragenococcus halophilus TaxID=51669 RepID=UPI00300FED49
HLIFLSFFRKKLKSEYSDHINAPLVSFIIHISKIDLKFRKNCLRFQIECVKLKTVKYRHVTGNAGRTFYVRNLVPSVFGSAFFV